MRVFGRKRRALVNTRGRLLLAAVSPADLHDSRRGVALLRISRRPSSFVALCYADRAYAGPRVAQATPIGVGLVARSGATTSSPSSRGLHPGQGFALTHWLVNGADGGRLFVRCFEGSALVRENAAGDVLASLTTMSGTFLSRSGPAARPWPTPR